MMATTLSIENGAARTEDRRGYFRDGAARTEDRDRDGAARTEDRRGYFATAIALHAPKIATATALTPAPTANATTTDATTTAEASTIDGDRLWSGTTTYGRATEGPLAMGTNLSPRQNPRGYKDHTNRSQVSFKLFRMLC
jgi:hypothetical protein